MKRRDWLLGSAGLGVLGGAGVLWSMRKGGEASDRLSVGLIGCGGHGDKLSTELLSRSDCDITHVCDPDSKRLAALQHKVAVIGRGRPASSRDLRHLLEVKSIDAVFVATPNHWHALAAVWAMQAGKHVYLEKPVSHSYLEGELLLRVARHTQRIVQAGLHRRSRAPLREAIRYIHEGRLGDVKLARCLAYKRRKPIGAPGKFRVPNPVDYELWAGPAPLSPVTRRRFHYDWHWFWEFGDGGLGNNGVHRIDVARWGLQLTGTGTSVVSFGGRFGKPDAGQTPNTQISVHAFGDKTIISELRGTPGEPLPPFDKGDGILFYGTRGILRYGSSRADLLDLDGQWLQRFEGKEQPDQTHIGNFFDAIKENRATHLNCSLEEGHYSSAMCHLAAISHRLGQRVSDEELPKLAGGPLAEELAETLARTLKGVRATNASQPFVAGRRLLLTGSSSRLTNDQTANSMLGRSYRPGFELPT